MRLIDAKTLELEEFFGDQIPKYAILSHVWGTPKDEVSFQEFTSPNRDTTKPGYQKIVNLCRLTLELDEEWAWCDTCCIDKTSSAELSEAINSMFQWYSDANICFAYLNDVEESEGTFENLRDSRCFTRGWTLQELIAPEEVNFYNSIWENLGSKTSLINELQQITKIKSGALSWPWSIRTFSIGTRLSWAARRTTTRIEDMSYCLLGILNVNMPLLYGEGSNAFQRLQTELIEVSRDETIFAHFGVNILAKSPADFRKSRTYEVTQSADRVPYTINNVGLSIYMRIVESTSIDIFGEGFLLWGVLGCHAMHDPDRPIAITLVHVENNIYSRQGSRLLYLDSTYMELPLQLITIQLAPPHRRSKLCCLLDMEAVSNEKWSCSITSSLSYVEVSEQQGNLAVSVFPRPGRTLPEVLRVYHQPWTCYVFFNQKRGKAGLLVNDDNGEDRTLHYFNSLHSKWVRLGCPDEGVVAGFDTTEDYVSMKLSSPSNYSYKSLKIDVHGSFAKEVYS